jgi:hypothetical protein
MPEADLRALTVPPELSPLQAQLAQQAVIDEMAIPGGLRFDEPVTDPVSQFKADVREVLAAYPPTLDTQLVAQYISDAMYVVPKADTAEPPEPPPPIPVLGSIDPVTAVALDEAQATLTAAGTGFLDGDFLAFAGVPQETTIVSDTEATCVVPVASVAGDVSVEIYGISGTSNPITFTYTEPPPPPEEDSRAAPEGAITPQKAPEPADAATGPIIGRR